MATKNYSVCVMRFDSNGEKEWQEHQFEGYPEAEAEYNSWFKGLKASMADFICLIKRNESTGEWGNKLKEHTWPA
jgi:hypothetical protein